MHTSVTKTRLDFVIWIIIISGTIITLAGVLMEQDTWCSRPPTLLYFMCVDPGELMVVVFGTFFMIAGSIALLVERFHRGRRGVSSNIRYALTHFSRIIIVAISTLIIAGYLMATSLYTAEAFEIYRTKIPLHVEMEGIKETYSLGERIDFTITLEGYGYDCGFPNVLLEKLNDDKTMSERVVWQLKDSGSVEMHSCSLFPVDVSKVVHLGDSEKPLIVNETGFYVASIEGSIGQEFVVNKR